MSNPVLSILIPCYNSGAYLPDALESIKNYSDAGFYEVIIVNDGSTDVATLALLVDLRKQGYYVIDQENKGAAAARNTAAKNAKGKYLLLLDSDNKVRPNYIEKGVQILNQKQDVSIVHGKPFFFGDLTAARIFETGKFDLIKMFTCNYIDTCAIIRRSVWEQLGGQDENKLIIGHADWEFWIRAGIAKLNFFYLEEICYDYRISDNSLLSQSLQQQNGQPEKQYIYNKHMQALMECYNYLYVQNLIYRQDTERPFRSFLKFLATKYLKK